MNPIHRMEIPGGPEYLRLPMTVRHVDLGKIVQIADPVLFADRELRAGFIIWHQLLDKPISLYIPQPCDTRGEPEKDGDGVPISLAIMQEVFQELLDAWTAYRKWEDAR